MKKLFCKKCKIMVKGNRCPICGSTNLTSTYYGRINVIDADKSLIAKKINIKQPGDYALKVR